MGNDGTGHLGPCRCSHRGGHPQKNCWRERVRSRVSYLFICPEAVAGTSETVVSASTELRGPQRLSSRPMIIRCTQAVAKGIEMHTRVRGQGAGMGHSSLCRWSWKALQRW